jgi:hypothetical protein
LDGDFDLIYDLYKNYPVIVVINKVDQLDFKSFQKFFENSLIADQEYKEKHSIKNSNIYSWVATSNVFYFKYRRKYF